MSDSALYFPYIEVPERPSLTRVLLYWDSLATIAPWGIPALSERTQELVNCGLVERLDPDDYLGGIESFEEGFFSLLESFTALDQVGATAVIHRGKATFNVWSHLRTKGLIIEDNAAEYIDGGWMRVPEGVARLYMAYLARCLGKALGRDPITSEHRAFAPLAGGPLPKLDLDLDRMRGLILRNVLPAPRDPVPPHDLARFKERHWEALASFRRHVEAKLDDCLDVEDVDRRERKLSRAAEELGLETEELTARMRHRWPTSSGMLCAAIANSPATVEFAAQPSVASAAAAASPLVAEVVRSMLGSGAATASGAVAYAALAQKQFGLEDS